MFRRILWSGIAGTLLLLGLVGYGVFVYPQQQARAVVAAALARLPAGWSGTYGTLDYGLVARRIVIGDLVLAGGETRIAISRLTLTGIDGDARKGSLLHAREAALDGFSLTAADGATTSVARAAATELAVDLASLGEALSRDDAVPALFVLPRFVSAGTARAIAYRRRDGNKIEEIAEITAEAIGHDTIGTILLSDCRSSGDIEGRIGTIRFSGVATDYFLAATSNSRSDVEPATPPLIRGVEWRGLAFSTPEARFEFDALELDGLRRSGTAPPTLARGAPPATLLAWLAGSFAADRFTVHAAGFAPSGATAAGFTVQRLELSGYDGGKLASGEATGIELRTTHSPPLKTAIEALRLRDADASRWLRLRADATASGATSGDGIFARIGGIDVTAFNSETTPGTFLRVASLHSELTDEGGRVTTKMSVTGAELPVDRNPLPPDQAAMLRPLGITALGIDLALAARWERAEGRLDIESLALRLAGLGEMTLAGSFTKVDGDCFGLATAAAALQRVAVERLAIHYHDASLVERLLEASAKQAGVPVEQLRTTLIGRANSQAQELAEPEATQALRQLARFLRDPREVTLTLAPPHPLGLAEAMATQATQLPKLLGLRVAVGQRGP